MFTNCGHIHIHIFFHILKVLEIIFKVSGPWTLWLDFYGKYEKTKTRGQIPGKAKMMEWNGWKRKCDQNMVKESAIFVRFETFFFPKLKTVLTQKRWRSLTFFFFAYVIFKNIFPLMSVGLKLFIVIHSFQMTLAWLYVFQTSRFIGVQVKYCVG